ALGHHRDLAHVDLLVLDEVLLAEAKLHVQGNRIRDTFTDTLDLGVLGFANRVGNVLEGEASVLGLDRENLAEHGLEALVLALLLRGTLLKIIEIGTDLEFDQVGRLQDFAKLAEVDAFGVVTDGHGRIQLNRKALSSGAHRGPAPGPKV